MLLPFRQTSKVFPGIAANRGMRGNITTLGTHAIRAIILLCSLTVMQANAKDIDGEFVVFSAGANSCVDYLNARRGDRADFEPYRQWLSGYLSAFNLIVVNTYDIVGERKYSEIIRWLDQYCIKNQKVSFVNASAALTVTLYPERRNLAPDKNNSRKWLDSGNLFSAENTAGK